MRARFRWIVPLTAMVGTLSIGLSGCQPQTLEPDREAKVVNTNPALNDLLLELLPKTRIHCLAPGADDPKLTERWEKGAEFPTEIPEKVVSGIWLGDLGIDPPERTAFRAERLSRPRSLTEVTVQIQLVGYILGREEQGSELMASVKEALGEAVKAQEPIPVKVVVDSQISENDKLVRALLEHLGAKRADEAALTLELKDVEAPSESGAILTLPARWILYGGPDIQLAAPKLRDFLAKSPGNT